MANRHVERAENLARYINNPEAAAIQAQLAVAHELERIADKLDNFYQRDNAAIREY